LWQASPELHSSWMHLYGRVQMSEH
jgi:hypothetical protein